MPGHDHTNAYVVGGFIAGIAGVIAGYPIDTVKVKIQSGVLDLDHGKPKRSFIRSSVKRTVDRLAQITPDESIRQTKIQEIQNKISQKGRPRPSSYWSLFKYTYLNGSSLKLLYKGVMPPIVSLAPTTAMAFYVEHRASQYINNLTEDTTLNHTLAGSISGCSQAFINGPTELIKIQMQVDNRKYSNSWQCTRDIVQNNGVKSLSKGMLITFLREIPAFATYFGLHNCILELLQFDPEGSSLEEIKPFFSGGIAGMASWYINYPVDCIKTRIQSCPINEKYGIRRGWRLLRKEGNMKYDMTLRTSGMRATLMRAFICNSVTFGTLSIFLREYDAYFCDYSSISTKSEF